MQRLQPMQILTLSQKLKFQKKCQNQFYKSFRVVLCKTTAPKNTNYSTNQSILKISHNRKAIAHVKSSLCVKNLNLKKHVKIHFTNHLELFCAKQRLQKTPNIREVRVFSKSPIMQRLQPMQNTLSGSKLKIPKHL